MGAEQNRGAAVGQALIPIPGVGAAVGAVAGGLLGNVVGGYLGGQVGNVNATLEVGALTEKVEVKAGSELVQTQSAAVSSTLSSSTQRSTKTVRNPSGSASSLPSRQVMRTAGPERTAGSSSR